MLIKSHPRLLGAFFAVLASAASAFEPLSRETGVLPVVLRGGKINAMGLPFTRQPVASGQVTGVSGPVITDSGAALGTLSGPHSLVVTKGSRRGKTAPIVSNTATTITLSAAISGLAVADEYEIIPDWTLNTLFGSTSNPSGLKSEFDASTSDLVIFFDASGATQRRYFSEETGTWVDPTDDLLSDKGNERIGPNSGLLIRRVPGPDITFLLQGAVRQGRQILDIRVGNNLYFHTNPAAVTLATSGLFTGNVATGVKQEFDASVADNVIVFRADGTTALYYYSEEISAWTDDGTNNRGTTAIPAGAAVLIRRRVTSGPGEFESNRTSVATP